MNIQAAQCPLVGCTKSIYEALHLAFAIIGHAGAKQEWSSCCLLSVKRKQYYSVDLSATQWWSAAILASVRHRCATVPGFCFTRWPQWLIFFRIPEGTFLLDFNVGMMSSSQPNHYLTGRSNLLICLRFSLFAFLEKCVGQRWQPVVPLVPVQQH